MKETILAIVMVFPLLSSDAHDGECVWYVVCGWDQDYGPDGSHQVHFLNCHYSGPAIPTSEQQVDLVKEVFRL